MVQEIITYVIVFFAVGLAVYKSYNRLKKKKSAKSAGTPVKSPVKNRACSGCIAECMLRDLPLKQKNEHARLCAKNIEEFKCS